MNEYLRYWACSTENLDVEREIRQAHSDVENCFQRLCVDEVSMISVVNHQVQIIALHSRWLDDIIHVQIRIPERLQRDSVKLPCFIHVWHKTAGSLVFSQ